MDALDRDALVTAVREVALDAVVNMLTAIPARLNPRRMADEFALTNRLRTEGTRHLLDAAAQSGVRRIIAQGLAFAYEPGDGPADEETPLWQRPPAPFASSVVALRELEAMTTRAGGTVLRLGHLYGPGTMFAADGSFADDVRAGKVPIAGAGASVFSFVHVADEQRPPRSPRWTTTCTLGCRTSSTTTRSRSGTGCPTWARCWARPDPGGCRSHSSGSLRADGGPCTSADCAGLTTHAPGTCWAGGPGTGRGGQTLPAS